MHQVVCTQDPITNNTINRLFEVAESLDFHAQELKNRKNKSNIHDQISKEGIDMFMVLIVNQVKRLAKHTLLEPYPS